MCLVRYIWLRVDQSYEPPDIKDPTLTQRTNINLDCVSQTRANFSNILVYLNINGYFKHIRMYI
jgi:hypothetical protein